MRHPLIRQGEGPTASSERMHREHVEHRKSLDRIYHDSSSAPANPPGRAGKRIGNRSPEGDASRLRGIPAIGLNVAGAIPGTNPERELIRKCPRDA